MSHGKATGVSPCPASYNTGQFLRSDGDEENLFVVGTGNEEALLRDFYGRFPWPWRPSTFETLSDPDFERGMLNQSLGDWHNSRIPRHSAIWVAGCGTSQALHTALKFPMASVVGSDVSTASLDICQTNAQSLNVSNLELRCESINEAEYQDQFDYVISTGVIHHNANPQETLGRIASSLKPDGILELMVYNRFHRTFSSCFQKAIRLFNNNSRRIDFEADLTLARSLVKHFPSNNHLADFLREFFEGSESDFADLLIHPIEHSYTVESLVELADNCGLEIILPCVTKYGRCCAPSILWAAEFGNPSLQAQYDNLPDFTRWKVLNLLLYDKSPLLWFFLQKRDSSRPRRQEKDICEEFLHLKWDRAQTCKRIFLRDEEQGQYRLASRPINYPAESPESSVAEIVNAIDKDTTISDICHSLDIQPTLSTVHKMRVYLTTSEFPHLRARIEV